MYTGHNQRLELERLHALASLAIAGYPSAYNGQLTLLCLSENATYALTTPAGQRYVLRLHRPNYHDHSAIASELAWLRALQADGLQVPVAITGLNGEYIQQAGANSADSRWAVLFEWIDGSEPDPQQALDGAFQRLGAINARLHQHARHWQRPTGFQRLTWDHESMLGANGHWGRWQDAPYLDGPGCELISTTLAQVQQRMQAYGKGPQRFGLIHADLRLANLLVDDQQTRVIDFDDCGFGWYMHDLAAALSFHEHHTDAPQWIDSWLQGYGRIAQPDQADLQILPTLIIQRRLQLLAWTGSHRGTPTVEGLGSTWVSWTLQLCRSYLQDRGVGSHLSA
jgi:Ser/Thr protein kinase RdoA (MazF antagonist)